MKDRFDLENEIMRLHTFAEDISEISSLLMESENIDVELCDKVTNVLNGISSLLSLHADKLENTMCQCFKLNEYREYIPKCDKWTYKGSSFPSVDNFQYYCCRNNPNVNCSDSSYNED
jgi:hypothetical protein